MNAGMILSTIYTNPTKNTGRSSLERGLKRALSLRSNPGQMPPGAGAPIRKGRMLRYPVVPNDNGAFLPLHPRVEVGSEGEVVVQEFENRIGLFLLEADDITGD